MKTHGYDVTTSYCSLGCKEFETNLKAMAKEPDLDSLKNLKPIEDANAKCISDVEKSQDLFRYYILEGCNYSYLYFWKHYRFNLF
jgi:hypothetical protein